MKKIVGWLGGIALAVVLFPYIPVTYNLNVGDFDQNHSLQRKINEFILKLADSNDTVKLHVRSFGGLVFAGLPQINAIMESSAHTVTINDTYSYSMGGLTAMAGDEIQASPISTYLFHRPYYMLGDKKILAGKNSPAYLMTQDFMKKKVFPYLHADEIALYNLGGDVIITGDDLIKRINK